jgi:hypothetical protein
MGHQPERRDKRREGLPRGVRIDQREGR